MMSDETDPNQIVNNNSRKRSLDEKSRLSLSLWSSEELEKELQIRRLQEEENKRVNNHYIAQLNEQQHHHYHHNLHQGAPSNKNGRKRRRSRSRQVITEEKNQINNYCEDQATCFCFPSKFENTCIECGQTILVGDCLKLARGVGEAATTTATVVTTGCYNYIHTKCPGYDKPLIPGFCEKRSKYDWCNCAPAQLSCQYTCHICEQPIKKGDCMPYKRIGQDPVHSRCYHETVENPSPCSVVLDSTNIKNNNSFHDIDVSSPTTHAKRRLLYSISDDDRPDNKSSATTTTTSTSRKRTISIGSIMFHKSTKRYYEIQDIHVTEEGSNAKRQVYVVCNNAYVKLEDTTIGQQEAKRILSKGYKWKFVQLQTNVSTIESLEEANRILSRGHPLKISHIQPPDADDGTMRMVSGIPIDELQSTNLTISDMYTELFWDPIQKGTNDGEHAWTFAFQSKNSHTGLPSNERITDQPPIAMNVFAGCGGVQLGFQKKGIKTTVAIENNPWAAETLQKNCQNENNNLTIIEEDARTVAADMESGIFEKQCPQSKESNVLCFEPPCQGHSAANPNGRDKEENNNDLTLLTTKIVKYKKNTIVFTFENVLGILEKDTKGKSRSSFSIFQEVIAECLFLGFQIRGTAVNEKDYGGSQSRKRVTLIGVKNGYMLPKMPSPTHGPGTDNLYKTVSDAIQDLVDFQPTTTTNIHQSLSNNNDNNDAMPFNHIIPGEDERYHYLPDYAVNWKERLDADKPAPTLKCLNALGHYCLDRSISVRERARLQGFPDVHKFYGPYEEQCKQIGNAVPIGISTAMATAVLQVFSHVK